MRESFARPRRKSMMAQTELPVVDAESEKLMEDDTVVPANAVKGVQAFYASQKKHIWFTVASILVFIIGFVIFAVRYPRAAIPPVEELGPIPDECIRADAKGCYNYATCIAPGYDRLGLAKPDCVDAINPCGYECTCTVLTPKDLTDADFALSRFLFFSPKVTYVDAGLGGAFVVSLFAAILLRKQHTTRDSA